MREAKLVAPENFVIASVQAPHQHWREDKGTFKIGFGWLTDHKPEESVALHQKFLLDLIEKLSSDETIDPGEVYLFGFSQACALNFRFAFTHPDSVKGVAGLCGGIPSDLSSNPAYFPTEADILYLFGDEDEFYPLDKFRSYDTKLQNYLPNYTSRQYSATHKITDEMRRDVKNWFAERK
jgi:predicted esterase